ncbi:hypothetical protein BHM03_00025482 [Ensete ventricosum]|nr:hypothetical protein BHM03_00025482 [Ensete ventricosum]
MVPRSSNATPAPISAIHRVYITIAPDRSRLRQVGHAYARSTVIVSGRLTAAWELECRSTIAQELDWSGTTAQELDGRALLLGNWTGQALMLGNWTSRAMQLGHGLSS